MKVVIIDDEEKSRLTLRNFIGKYESDVEIIGEADGVVSGMKLIKSENPEAVFLDVEMKDGSGFDLLDLMSPVDFMVVFVTAFNHYAVKAFRFSAVDYLLKPLDPSRLKEAVRKLKDNGGSGDNQQKLNTLLENRNSLKKLALPAINGLIMIRVSNILRLESEINYTRVFLKSNESHLVTKTLKEYDELLSGINFYRIHKSHLINLDCVSRYVKGEGGTIILEDDSELEVARRRKEGLLQALTHLSRSTHK